MLGYLGQRQHKAAAIKADADAAVIKARFEAVEAREQQQFDAAALLESRLFDLNAQREHELQTGSVYMALETHSSEIFQFTAQTLSS